MKTALEIKRNVTKSIEQSILSQHPNLKSVQSLPDDLRAKVDELIYEQSSLLLDIQQELMNPNTSKE